MNLLSRFISRSSIPLEERAGLLELFQSWESKTEKLTHDFTNYVADGYKSNGVVFAVILARLLLFSEAMFKFRRFGTTDLYGSQELTILERPWPNGTTGEMLARMEQDVSLAGNAYIYRAEPTRLQRLRPDWVDIVTDEREVFGYLYTPGGSASGKRSTLILPEELAHWSPIPDPTANFRGMSWLTPVVREVNADTDMTKHKGLFFKNAATPNLLIKVLSKLAPEARERIEARLKQRFEGTDNAYRTLLLEGGADATIIGHSFEQMTFATVQAAGENRIAAAAGVPGIVVGLKEGLQAATYSNYSQAMRRFGDLTMRPLWRSASASIGKLVKIPAGSELWYDDRNIPALKQDAKDAADILRIKAETIASLIRVGYDPAQVAAVVESGMGLNTLTHSGGIPVTLYPEGKNPSGNGAAVTAAET